MATNWHNNVFFGIHYDLHANASDTGLGRDLTAEHLRERLLRVRPDWIQADCKGHPGYTSWHTEIGSTSPGAVKDALRIHRDVTRELGIKLGMHYSGVWDSRAIELHPDWARLDETGRPDPNMTCRMSGYDEQLMIPQMLEIVDRYDVDGFWVDGENWASKPCWCDRCRAEFTRRTRITAVPMGPGEPNLDAWLAFHRDLFVEHVTRYADAIHARKPDCQVCSNWMYTVRQPDPVSAPVDYLSGDYDWSWGASRAAVEGRVLDGRGKSWDLMAWGFTKTGAMGANPPWVMKTTTHLCQELAEVIALGGAVMIYNQPQRSGWLTGWHQDLFAEVAEWCRARKDACFKSQTASQVAVLHLADHYYSCNQPLFNYGEAVQPVEGALHALLETHRSTDILTEEAALQRMGDYSLVIVPEQTRLSPAIVAALEAFAQSGGHVLMSGAHLAAECPALVGAIANGAPITSEATYLPIGGRALPVSGAWQPVQPAPGTSVLAYRLAQQEPDKDTTGQAIAMQRPVGSGSIISVHGPVFRDYFLGHYPLLRQLIGGLVARLDIAWEVTVEAPPRLEMIARRKESRLVINLVNRGAAEALSPNRVIVEEVPPVTDVVLRIRRDSAPQSVSVVPDQPAAKWEFSGGMLTVRVSRVAIHSAIVID